MRKVNKITADLIKDESINLLGDLICERHEKILFREGAKQIEFRLKKLYNRFINKKNIV